MRKPIAQMTDHEMLLELMAEKRSADHRRYARLAVWAVLAIAAAILLYRYLPPVLAYFRELRATAQQIEQTLQQIRTTTDNVRETVTNLGESGASMLRDVVERINELLDKVPRIFR